MRGCVPGLDKLVRKKICSDEDLLRSELRRCLSTIEVVGLGVGSTFGAGLYIISGQVARESAGPAVVLSFLIAGLAASLAGLSYAEFAARVPSAGSAYVYTYVTVGELMAFVIGWNIIMEYVINIASLARAVSAYVDYLIGNHMQQLFQHYVPISVPGLSSYPDFFALALVIFATGIAAIGIKESATVTNILTLINVIVIVLIIICGFVVADPHNWHLSGEELPASGAGSGGFAPFGISGIMAGAATCFFAYIGFDFIASLGEEAENCRWSIPVSMGATLVINMVGYCCVAAVVTLLAPYYILDIKAPVAFAFDQVGWRAARYVISVGAFCGMASSLMAGVFPMARVVYAMSSDGLIFRFLSTVSPRFHTPVASTLVSGALAGTMALLFDLSELIDMLSIGTLLAFALVAVCVLLLRYKTDDNAAPETESSRAKTDVIATNFRLLHLIKPCSGTATESSARIVSISVAVICVSSIIWAVTVSHGDELWKVLSVGTVVIATILGCVILAAVVIICRQPQNSLQLRFKVPLVPLIPVTSILINVYLMVKLSAATWLRFGIWLVLGFCIYFAYGVRHSSLNASGEEQSLLFTSDDWANYTESNTNQKELHAGSDSDTFAPSGVHDADHSSPRGPHHDRASGISWLPVTSTPSASHP